MNGKTSDRPRGDGFLSRLARDTRGNTLAMMAAFTIPLAALAGSAVDMSRAYLVKVRLQQACDAGVLAGRKLMTADSGTALDKTGTAAASAATAFFRNNFPSGWMNTTPAPATFTAVRTDTNQVAGTASATMPMAIMGMFGFGAVTQTVTCTARLDIGDSDIMFVLDTTGSMACRTGTACTSTQYDATAGYYQSEQPALNGRTSKIEALRGAVKLFRTTLANNKPAAAHIRYGFVTYASSVNLGDVLTADTTVKGYLADNSTMPSRELATNASGTSLTTPKLGEVPDGVNTYAYYTGAGNFNQGDVNYNTSTAPTAQAATPVTKTTCFALARRRFSTTGTTNQPIGTWPTSGTVSRLYPVWNSSTSKCTTFTWTVKPLWRYGQITRNLSTFKSGGSLTDPTKITAPTTTWQGCITERNTTTATTSTTYDTDNLPADMDPDLVPTSDATRWHMMWPEAVYYRPGTGSGTYYYAGGTTNTASSDPVIGSTAAADYSTLLTTPSLAPNAQYYGCGAPARTLAEMTEDEFTDYLGTSTTGNFRAMGHTYHDVGMIWGLRLLSPDGPWASTTAAWGSNNPPNRYIVFMTDGDILPDPEAYHLYGVNNYEAGVAAVAQTVNTLSTIHTNRFLAVCEAAKAKNITVFVIQFDNGTDPSQDMKDCATEGYAYAANTPTELEDKFTAIALQIARLRLSQ